MEVTYIAKSYKPDLPVTRYVRRAGDDVYFWCEVIKGWDVRQGTADKDDVPERVRDQADAVAGRWPSYVEWKD